MRLNMFTYASMVASDCAGVPAAFSTAEVRPPGWA